MKAKDLMIGDYVSLKPSGMIIKVAAVHNKKVAYHAVVNRLSWVCESLLEPIPITPEFLKKNNIEELSEMQSVHTLQHALRLFEVEKEIIL